MNNEEETKKNHFLIVHDYLNLGQSKKLFVWGSNLLPYKEDVNNQTKILEEISVVNLLIREVQRA